MEYYNASGEESEVMSLEEIANLVKEFDDYYSGEAPSNPLKYLNIRETTTNEGEEAVEESTYIEEQSAE
ncbi:hypothetical protein QNH98_07425 [Myroides sp. mNGS23_01]|nr:hypothetical protein [Myroides sp. mNGS23_01]WHT40400.1 hypothetical protein QNH98_07425 [Myroides sp. mNGS23_01]